MTLRHVSLEEKPTFDALSYEWGPESTNNSDVFVDKKRFIIRENLWLFLKRLRAFSESARVIYADAICINQRDNEEKGRQVALMSEIYMRAKKVLIWLGEHDQYSELVFGTHFEDAVAKVPKLFRGLRLTFDHAEEILDVLFDNNQYKTQNSIVIATIAKAFDLFGLLKPERKQWILPQTKALKMAEEIIYVTRQWRATQKNSGNWYNLRNTAQVHRPPGLEFLQLDEPLWSHYTTLRDNNMNNLNTLNNLNIMNMNNMNMMNNVGAMNNMGMMGGGAGGMGGGGC
ncbi:heterokaryon incompatibility -domain-containing protein [Rutstroemia sp. NJR-2017a BBW]|nr:heterokaryon incompatibility -domain-containing protein [Rutstroemia sp. NJR-2017a BBW]